MLTDEPLDGLGGGLVTIAGTIVQFMAWIGALVNSYGLQDKTWFVITLVLGCLAGRWPKVPLSEGPSAACRPAQHV